MNKKSLPYVFGLIGIFCLGYFVLCYAEGKRHIYPTKSGKGLYLGYKGYMEDPSCIINAEAERTIDEMAQDFGECMKVHQKYRAKAGY
jgi:hypothetical protein